jgi:23S rRNA pseudouridine2605 synthase
MRLQRALARSGVASRRRAEQLIRDGRVRVNGVVAELGSSADPERDVITVGGRRIKPVKTVWIALNKPVGYVVSRRDPDGRDTVFSLVPEVPGLTYVGRLDVATAGLLLLTTDGEGAHHLAHPRFKVQRTYRVLAHGRSTDEVRNAFRHPIVISGRRVEIVRFRTRTTTRGSTELTLTVAEGRNRIVRRICEQVGLKVERLTRLSYGPIVLGRLAPGAWRYLSTRETQAVGAIRAGR